MPKSQNLLKILLIVLVLGLLTTGLVFSRQNKFSNLVRKAKRNLISDENEAVESKARILPKTQELGLSRPPMPGPGSDQDALEIADRIYEQSAYYQLVVNDPNSYLNQVKEYLVSLDGRILTTNLQTTDRYQYGYITAKVPVSQFDQATQKVTENVDKLVSQSINAYDRTGWQQQLKNQKESLQEQKLDLEIQLEQAKTDLERKRLQLQITRIDKQLTQFDQQEKNLEEKVQYSTLNLSVANTERFFNPNSYQPSLMEQLKAAWESLGNVFYLALYVLIWLGVYSLVWLPLVLLFWFVKGRLSQKSAAKKEAKKTEDSSPLA